MKLLVLLGAAATTLFACAQGCTTALSAAGNADVVFQGSTNLGYTVNALGDLNGDGFADLAVAAPSFSNGRGAVHIAFGRSGADWAQLGGTFELSAAATPNASSWIRISGGSSEYLGQNAAAHGDFNGDGFSDILLGAQYSSVAYCVYGQKALNSLTPSNVDFFGFTITLSASSSVSVFGGNAGDMNGDGIEDILVTSYDGTSSSMAYVIFGDGSHTGSFYTSTIDGNNGFRITEESPYFALGVMESPGDINGDGFKDMALGSWDTGSVYIIFAKNISSPWDAQLDLPSDLNGNNGFLIVTDSSNTDFGWTVVGAGDVNADGFADIFIGSKTQDVNRAWIVFGHPAPWSPVLNVSKLNGTNGFLLLSEDSWGFSGGAAGDVNGDGFDDVLIGGYNAFDSVGTRTGAAAIIFGHDGSFPAVIHREELVGSVGFQIDGPSVGSEFGYSARGAGDVNGDGIADFIVGAPYYKSGVGFAAALFFGTPNDHCAVCSNTTDACLICGDGFILNETICEANLAFSSSSSSAASSDTPSSVPKDISSTSHSTVVVIIRFNESINDPTELEEEIASVLGIDAGLVSVVVISPTEVEVTIIGGQEIAQQLVDIINNGGTGSDGSGLGLLRKAIDAHIRKDTDDGSSGDDGVDAARHHVALSRLAAAVAAFAFTTRL